MMVQAEAAPPGRFPLLLIEDGEAAILALAFTQPPVFPTWFNELLDHLGENTTGTANTNAKVQRPHIFCPLVRGWQ